jgi:hypothetical protein
MFTAEMFSGGDRSRAFPCSDDGFPPIAVDESFDGEFTLRVTPFE